MKYSIVIPHLKSSPSTELCLKYLEQNSMYEHEIVEILDETDVYYAFNRGVYRARCETVVLLSDDMMVAKNWDRYIPKFSSQDTILTGYVVEPDPGKMFEGPECIKHDCGTLENFNYSMFQQFVDQQEVDPIRPNAIGWYQPLVVNQKSFVTYPNIHKFPNAANDSTLILDVLPKLGYKFAQIDMWAYHFQRQSLKTVNKKRCIFTYNNFQVDEKIVQFQKMVIDRLNNIPNCKYEYLRYNAPDGEVFPDAVIDYAFKKLFYEDNYDTILLLDIDCVPMNLDSLLYCFEQAEKNILIGNIQRSNHIDNNEHTYVSPSAMCISKELFEKLGQPSFAPNNRGDVGESLTYRAEQMGIQIEKFMPTSYEKLPYKRDTPWPLSKGLPDYGIGTTFVNDFGKPMFYHLFQSSMNLHNQLFYMKCIDILKS